MRRIEEKINTAWSKIYTVWSRNHHTFNYGEQVVLTCLDDHGRLWAQPAYTDCRTRPSVIKKEYLWHDEMGYNNGTEYR